jgi:hypothetical protein
MSQLAEDIVRAANWARDFPASHAPQLFIARLAGMLQTSRTSEGAQVANALDQLLARMRERT